MFSRVQQSMGGRLRFIITGSAPISSKVMDFARVAFGCQVQHRKGEGEGREGEGALNSKFFVLFIFSLIPRPILDWE